MGTASGGAEPVRVRSADGMTSTELSAPLLAGVSSASEAPVETVECHVPVVSGRTTTVTVAVAPGGRVPREHCSLLPSVVQNAEAMAGAGMRTPGMTADEMSDVGEGRVCVSVTCVAGDGPLLVTFDTEVTSLPRS